ncbi:hypothetical protein JCM10450v2_001185 [Rhodotorula kratochvilovae]
MSAVLAGQSLPRLVKARAPALHRAATVQAAPALFHQAPASLARPAIPNRANPLARAGPPPFDTAASLLEPSWLRANLRQHSAQGRITL